VTIQSSLATWASITRQVVAKEGITNQEKLFSGNVRRIYRFSPANPT